MTETLELIKDGKKRREEKKHKLHGKRKGQTIK
jgi:hypothetical protein